MTEQLITEIQRKMLPYLNNEQLLQLKMVLETSFQGLIFDKGEELVVVPFKGWNIGMLICADYGFSELSTQLAIKMGADMIIYPSAWYPGWEDLFVTSCKMRAAENQIYTIGMNRASGNRQYCGNTTVANPDGSILMRLETTGEAYGRVTLFKEKIDAARDALPWRKMKREDIYSKF